MAILISACGATPAGASRLAGSLDSISAEMMALHEPRRIVEYHDRSGKPFWIAFIAADAGPHAFAAAGLPPDPPCPASHLTTVAVGGGERTECVTVPRVFVSNVRAVHKEGRATVQVTLDLDVNGVRIVKVD